MTEKFRALLREFIKAEVELHFAELRARMTHPELSATPKDMRASLDQLYPSWREIVGEFGSRAPFRLWLEGQDQAYQDTINSTRSPGVILDAINAFMAQNREGFH